ncbi:hypothetical protein JCM10207_000591 [Rhodosporidiobolus poonsookiae]
MHHPPQYQPAPSPAHPPSQPPYSSASPHLVRQNQPPLQQQPQYGHRPPPPQAMQHSSPVGHPSQNSYPPPSAPSPSPYPGPPANYRPAPPQQPQPHAQAPPQQRLRVNTGPYQPQPPQQAYSPAPPPPQNYASPAQHHPKSSPHMHHPPPPRPPQTVEQAIAASLPPSAPSLPPPPHAADPAFARAQHVEQQRRQADAEAQFRAASRGAVRDDFPPPGQGQGQGARQAGSPMVQDFAAGRASAAPRGPVAQPAPPRTVPVALDLPADNEQRTLFHSYLLDYLQRAGLYSTAAALLSDVPSLPTHPPQSGRSYPSSSRALSAADAQSTLRPGPESGPGALFLASPSALSPQKSPFSPTRPLPMMMGGTPSPTRLSADDGSLRPPANADTVGSTSSLSSSGAGSHYGFEGLRGAVRDGEDEEEVSRGGSPRKRGSGASSGSAGEGRIPAAQVPIESEHGFLYEWWTVFWDVFRAKAHRGGTPAARSFVDASSEAVDLAVQQQLSAGFLARAGPAAARQGAPMAPGGRPMPAPGQQQRPVIPLRQASYNAPSPTASGPPAPSAGGGGGGGAPPARRSSLTMMQAQQVQQMQLRAQEAAHVAAQQAMSVRGAGAPGKVTSPEAFRNQPLHAVAENAPSPGTNPHGAALARQSSQHMRQQQQHAQAVAAQRQQQQEVRERQQRGGSAGHSPAGMQVETPQGLSPAAMTSPQKAGSAATPPFQQNALNYSPSQLQQAVEARNQYRAQLLAAQERQLASAVQHSASKGKGPAATTPQPIPDGMQYVLTPEGNRSGLSGSSPAEGSMPPPAGAGRRGASAGLTPQNGTVPLPPTPTASGDVGVSPAASAPAVGTGKRRRASLSLSLSEKRETKKRTTRDSGRPPSATAMAPTSSTSSIDAAKSTAPDLLPSGLVDISESPADIDLTGDAAVVPASAGKVGDIEIALDESEMDETTAFLNSLGAAAADDASFVAADGILVQDPPPVSEWSMDDLNAMFSSAASAADAPFGTATTDAGGGFEVNYDDFMASFGDSSASYDPTTFAV